MAKLDVGMPVRNGHQFIGRALTSLMQQGCAEFRLLVSDSGSSDGTLGVVNAFARHDSRIRVVSHVNTSAPENFLYLLEQSTAEFFMFAAHDDMWSSVYVERALAALEDGASYFVPNWFVGSLESGRGLSTPENPLGFLTDNDPRFRVLNFINLHHASHKCNLIYSVFRTSFLREIVERVGLDNDGLVGACVAFGSAGQVSNEVLFWKHNGRVAGNYVRDRNRKRLDRYGVNRLLAKGRASKSFFEAKRSTLARLLQQFPEFDREISEIFAMYERSSWLKGYRISDLASLDF